MVKKPTGSEGGPRDLSVHEAARGRKRKWSPPGPKEIPVGPARPSRALIAGICLALGLVTFAIYAQVFRYGFIELDDNCYVYENPIVRKGLWSSGVAWAFTTFQSANWHPLTWLSHMLDCRLFGLNAGAHRLVNLGFHAASAIVLFIAFVRMTRRPWRSALVAGIFAVHPLHVESVAWIAERKDVLSTFFGALTLIFYVRYAEAPSALRYATVALGLALGLMAKPMLVTLPFVFLLLDVWPLRRLGWPPAWKTLRPLLREKIPLFAMVAAASVVTFIAQQKGGAVSGLARLPFSDRFANAGVAYVSYIWKAFWPVKLAVLYPYQAHQAQTVFAAAALLAAATIAAVACAKKRPYFLVGWLWYLGMLVPVIGLVQVGAQSMADRYTYLPLAGLSICAVWLAGDLVERRPLLRNVSAAVACAALVLLAAQTYRQAAYWKSSQSLFEHALGVTDRNYIIHKSLGVVLDHEGKSDKAVAQYRQALAIKPDFAEAHNNLGMILDREGKRDEAMAHYEAALASQSDYAEPHNNIGVILDREGKLHEAMACYEKALALRPDFADAHRNLAMLLDRAGRPAEAMAHYRQALAIDPDSAEAHNNMGVILAREGRFDEAAAHYREALAINAGYAEAHANLGHELMRSGKFDESYLHLAKALEALPKRADVQADMGLLLAAQGRFDEARTHFEESLRIAPGQPIVHSNLAFVLLQLKRTDEAIAHCAEALRLEPRSVDAHYNMGMALAVQGKKSEATAEFSKVLALSPGHAGARAALEKLQGAK